MNAEPLEVFWIIIVGILLCVRPDTPRGRVLRISTCVALVASVFARHFEFSDRDHVFLVIAVFVGTNYAVPQLNPPTKTEKTLVVEINGIAKWIVPLVRPDSGLVWTNLLWIGTIIGFRYWSDLLPTEIANWLGHQTGLTKYAVYFAGAFVLYIVALIIVMKIVSPIHYAIDPAYAAERAQKRKVQKFKIGDRVRVSDRKGEIRGTITRINQTGEYFDVTWDDGHKTNHSHFAVDDFEPSY
jgi:hypothetical protein